MSRQEIVLTLSLWLVGVNSLVIKCPPNEEYKACKDICPATCLQKIPPKFCIMPCLSGCDCLPGFIRTNTTGSCVPEKDCPGNVCKENEEWSDCGSACPRSCNVKKPGPCITLCVEGCFCKEGFIKDEKTGECIPEKLCPREICKENEEWTDCVSCPRYCNDTEILLCKQICREGCDCKKGYIRDKKTGLCVSEESCTGKCGENEEFLECGSSCPPSCQPIKTRCIRKCVRGCFCKKGLVRDLATNKCLKKEECPPKNC